MMDSKTAGSPQITPHDPEHSGSRRDPEERQVENHLEGREKSFDKTLADSFPTSDPPSSIPDPGGEHAAAQTADAESHVKLLAKLPKGSWAAFAVEGHKLVGTGATRDEAEENAKKNSTGMLELVQVTHEAKDALNQAS
jgi:hypothetical protein